MTIPLPNTLRNKKIVISLLGKEATFTFRNFPEPEEVLKINLRKLLLQTRLWKTPRCKSPKLTSFEVTGITISHGKTTNKNPIFFFFFIFFLFLNFWCWDWHRHRKIFVLSIDVFSPEKKNRQKE